jgi:uncharacterized phage-associated protein
MPIPANTVADLILREAHEKGFVVSNLKLQKLLYYVEVYHLGNHGNSAINEPFKAWADGPVVPDVHHRFKPKFQKYRTITEVPPTPKSQVPATIYDTVTTVVGIYGALSQDRLVAMTHAETPWLEARGTGNKSHPLNPNTMKTAFPKIRHARPQRTISVAQHRIPVLPLPKLEGILEEFIDTKNKKRAAALEKEFLEGYFGKPLSELHAQDTTC